MLFTTNYDSDELERLEELDSYYEDSENDSYNDDYNTVYEHEKSFLDSEKEHGKMYIGLYRNINGELVMQDAITPKTFFQFNINTVVNYLYFYSIIPPVKNDWPKIYRLDIKPDGTYTVIDKTFWLKIVQRKWKKIMQLRKEILLSRMSIFEQKYKQIHGKYMKPLPTLRGMF
jgi:hypothetical protein